MSKWADYLITGVRFDANNTFIQLVEIRKDKGNKLGKLGEPNNMTRDYIVNEIKKGTTFITAYKNNNNEWEKGAMVEIIRIDNTDYIKTKKNSTKKDNLDNLRII